jgi:hypothetical protein
MSAQGICAYAVLDCLHFVIGVDGHLAHQSEGVERVCPAPMDDGHQGMEDRYLKTWVFADVM